MGIEGSGLLRQVADQREHASLTITEIHEWLLLATLEANDDLSQLRIEGELPSPLDITYEGFPDGSEGVRLLAPLLKSQPGLLCYPLDEGSDREPRVDAVVIAQKARALRLRKSLRRISHPALLTRDVPKPAGAIVGDER